MKIAVKKEYIICAIQSNFSRIEIVDLNSYDEEVEILIADTKDIDSKTLALFPNLKWIQCCRAGIDGIDVQELKQRNIQLSNARDLYSQAISEDVVCKILMANGYSLEYMRQQNQHNWKPLPHRKCLSKQVVGMIGTGSIATEVAKRLQPFGAKVYGYKRTPVLSLPYFDGIFTGDSGLKKLLSQCDILVIACDLNQETFHIMQKETFALMRKGTILINIARGSCICTKDLLDALRDETLQYAMLDVFEEEPLPQDHPLWDMNNVYITPHASGITMRNHEVMCEFIVSNINHYIAKEVLINQVHIQ